MMKYCFLLALLFFVVPLQARTHASFKTELNQLLRETPQDYSFAIVIAEPATHKILFEKNSNRNFAPASTLKLFTAFSGLFLLGPQYRFNTELYSDTQNLYLKFSGDPSLTISDLDLLLQQAAIRGLHNIPGKLLIDDTSQDQNYWSNGTLIEDKKFCYCAPVGAMIINQNCISVEAIPNSNHTISLVSDEINYVSLHNQLSISKDTSDADLTVNDDNSYLLTGTITDKTLLKIAVQNNRLFCKKIITRLLQKNNITTNGIDFGKAQPHATLVANHESPILSDLITVMLKESNNTIAQAIFRILPDASNTKNNWESGSIAVKNLLQSSLHIPQDEFVMKDGAGASVYNLIKPKQLLLLLNYMYHYNYDMFKKMLPQAGVDGTLKNRMKEPLFKVFAKTGTETGVSSLAGYVETRNNHVISFVIMINQGMQPNTYYRTLEDKICYLIYRYM